MKIDKSVAVHLNLWKQGLYHPGTGQSRDAALDVMRQIGCVQLDTLNVLTRTHNLIFWARMERYEEAWFLEMYRELEVFEGYVHALSLFPMEEYPYIQPVFQATWEQIQADGDKAEFLAGVYEQVREKGALTSRDLNGELEDPNFAIRKRVTEKDWVVTPVRWSLDRLWRSGRLYVSRDAKFTKIFELTENCVPDDLRMRDVSVEEMTAHLVQKALQAMGAATVDDLADYFRMDKKRVRSALHGFLQAGDVREVEVSGDQEAYFIRAEDLDLAHSDAFQEPPTHRALLSPFDNLIWFRPRLQRLFGVDFRLESYVPQAQRKYGYFALPILLRGRIVGTIDLKIDRKKRTLHVQKLVLFDPSEKASVREDLHVLLRRMMEFLQAEHLQGLSI